MKKLPIIILILFCLIGKALAMMISVDVDEGKFKTVDDYCAKTLNWVETNCTKEFGKYSNVAIQECQAIVEYNHFLNQETNGALSNAVWIGM